MFTFCSVNRCVVVVRSAVMPLQGTITVHTVQHFQSKYILGMHTVRVQLYQESVNSVFVVRKLFK